MSAPRTRGRPESTSRGDIEQAAFALFARQGFDGTTVDQIAAAVGVTRRTLFRYYPSKNDIPWGDFDAALVGFRQLLDAQDADLALWTALSRAIAAFNSFSSDARPAHADRMRLILSTPALQAHSALRHEAWRAEVVRFVRLRRGLDEQHPLPGLLAHVALATSLASYDQWLSGGDPAPARLEAILLESFDRVRAEMAPGAR
ncbi:TetR family transcriptional regulator [Nocardioides sp. TRM66260-LWL]|uniref:acyl-CoA-like ligand-binding transcription factor n=1 Tax=Nocardioides sp. TRM66260-LWL TaxID=2874478 RepID=UPI001CC75AA5|nr:TetR family transcriptional regulator [Nocardioides sp. TRM66260-LWL]MBZ5735339.1 TetR family transcriptional regulator [Nocardioides sp. TRM66260-LWL]